MLAAIGMACGAQKVADLLHGDPQVSGLQQQAQPLSVNGLFWLTVPFSLRQPSPTPPTHGGARPTIRPAGSSESGCEVHSLPAPREGCGSQVYSMRPASQFARNTSQLIFTRFDIDSIRHPYACRMERGRREHVSPAALTHVTDDGLLVAREHDLAAAVLGHQGLLLLALGPIL